jgi:hypothetical protein
MSLNINRRLQVLEKLVGNDEQANQSAIEAEWIIISRMRLEGVSVWSDACGHVLYPLDFLDTRKTYLLMMQAEEERIRKHISDTLHFCAKHDPYLLDANYPLLEYFLWTLLYLCNEEKCFRPLTIPAEICALLLAIKPEESLHYKPTDWCYECGYGYPSCTYGASHDQLAFLTTRYSRDEIDVMSAPYRGKDCLLCGGEIKRHEYSHSERWQQSPAHRLRQSKQREWQEEIEAVELPEDFLSGLFVPHDREWKAAEASAKADFMQRRAKQNTIRVQHQPSVEAILRYTRGR